MLFRSVAGLVFAAEDFGNFRAQATEHLIGGVDEDPLFLDALGVGCKSLVA